MPVASIRAGHKYLRREGSPGDYRYFYYEPGNGRGRATSTAEEHALAKVDHVRRMLATGIAGREAVTAERVNHIARTVGVTPTAVRWELSNMRARGRRAVARNPGLMPGGVSSYDVGHHGHGYAAHHLAEANFASTVTPEYEEVVTQKRAAEAALHGPTEQETARANYREVRARDDAALATGRTAQMEAGANDLNRRIVEAARVAATWTAPTTTPAAAPVPKSPSTQQEVRVGTRLTMGIGSDQMALYEVTEVQPSAFDPANDAFMLRMISGPASYSRVTALRRGSLDLAIVLPEGNQAALRVAYHTNAQATGTTPHEAPSTQQTAEARARVAAAHRPGTTEPPSSRATVVSSVPTSAGAKRTAREVERHLRNLGFNLGTLNLPEAEMARTLGPETPKERQYRAQTVLAQHGFDLGALHLPVGDDAA